MSSKGTVKRALYIAKQRHGYQAGGFPMTLEDWAAYDPFGRPKTQIIPPWSDYKFYKGPEKPSPTPTYAAPTSGGSDGGYANWPDSSKGDRLYPDRTDTGSGSAADSGMASPGPDTGASTGPVSGFLSDYFSPGPMAAGLTGSLLGTMVGGPIGGLVGGFAGRGLYSSMKGDEDRAAPISSSTSYGPGTTSVSQAPSAAPAPSAPAPVDTSWVGDLSGAKASFATPDVSPMAFAEGKSATLDAPALSFGPYGNLEGAKSSFAQQAQTDEEAAAQAEAQAAAAAAASEDQGGGLVGGGLFGGGPEGSQGGPSGNDGQGGGPSGDGQGGGPSGDGQGGPSGDNQGGGPTGDGPSGDGQGGGPGGDGEGGGGGGGGDGEKRGGRIYPLRHHADWEESTDYEKSGGKLVHMSPAEYLKRVKHLDMDHHDKHLIHHFEKQMKNGEKMDPLAIYPDQHPNGRHRAHAAEKLGIKKVPVVIWPKKKSEAKKDSGSVVKQALMLTSKRPQATGDARKPS